MRIDVPVTILFDCAAADSQSVSHAAGKLVGTLRYDPDGDGSDAVLFNKYPPDEKPIKVLGKDWVPEGEPAQGLLAHMPRGADLKIINKAKRYPEDYLVGTDAEREVAQKIADEEARDQPQGF